MYVVVTNVPLTLNCTSSAVFIGVGVAAAISVAFVVLNLISLKSKFFPFNTNKSFFFISILSVFGSNFVQVPLPFSSVVFQECQCAVRESTENCLFLASLCFVFCFFCVFLFSYLLQPHPFEDLMEVILKSS